MCNILFYEYVILTWFVYWLITGMYSRGSICVSPHVHIIGVILYVHLYMVSVTLVCAVQKF